MDSSVERLPTSRHAHGHEIGSDLGVICGWGDNQLWPGATTAEESEHDESLDDGCGVFPNEGDDRLDWGARRKHC